MKSRACFRGIHAVLCGVIGLSTLFFALTQGRGGPTVSFSPRHFASPTGVMLDPHTGLRLGGADPFGYGVAGGR